MNNDVIWEELPRRGGSAARTAAILEELEAHPGRWAKVSISLATAYNVRWRRPGEFEIRSVGNADGKRDTYMRSVQS